MTECKLDLNDFDVRTMLDLFFKWCVDDFMDAQTSRAQARIKVRDIIKPPPDPATWGFDEDALRGQQAAMEIVP